MIPRGIRNNNPGNIIKSGIAWEGEKTSLDETVFEVFDTSAHGLEALCKLLVTYQDRHELRTVRGIISRWSATDQDTYIANVARRLDVGPDAQIDLHHAGTLVALADAIVWQENGEQPYPAELIAAAAAKALGIPHSTAPAVPESPPAYATPPPAIPVPPTQGKLAMDPLTIIGLVGPLLQTVLPLVGTLFGGKKDAANAQLIGTVLNTVSQTAGTVAAGQPATLASTATAIEKMQADPAVQKSVQEAVVTHPDVITQLGIVEIGGGIAAARAADAATAQADKPFWYAPTVWVALFVFFLVAYATIMVLGGAAGVSPEIKSFVLGCIFTTGFGSVIAYFFGTTQQSGKKDDTIAKVATSP